MTCFCTSKNVLDAASVLLCSVLHNWVFVKSPKLWGAAAGQTAGTMHDSGTIYTPNYHKFILALGDTRSFVLDRFWLTNCGKCGFCPGGPFLQVPEQRDFEARHYYPRIEHILLHSLTVLKRGIGQNWGRWGGFSKVGVFLFCKSWAI
jgi:hypothetical protein